MHAQTYHRYAQEGHGREKVSTGKDDGGSILCEYMYLSLHSLQSASLFI